MHQEEITEFWMMHLKRHLEASKNCCKNRERGWKNIGNVDRNQALKSTTFPIRANLYLFKNTNSFLNAFNIQLLKEIQL